MSFVVDCSVTLAWCFEDEEDETADAAFAAHQNERAVVPAFLWELEVTNGLLVAKRRGRLQSKVEDMLDALRRFDLHRLPVPDAFTKVVPLAEKHALSSYDAAYLSVASEYGLPLATLD